MAQNLATAERNSHNTITFNNISKPPVILGSLTLVSFSCVRGGETATSPDHRFLLELLLSDTSATYERFGTYGCLACSSSSSSWDGARDIRRPRQPLLPPPSCVRKTSEKYEVESLSSRPPFPVSVVDKTATFPGYWLPAVCPDHCTFINLQTRKSSLFHTTLHRTQPDHTAALSVIGHDYHRFAY